MSKTFWSDVAMPSQIMPTRWIFELHNLQLHSSVSQSFNLDLNFDKYANSLQPSGKNFQRLVLKEVIVSVPNLADKFILRILYVKFLNLKMFSMITGLKPLFILKTVVASICKFLLCVVTRFPLPIN